MASDDQGLNSWNPNDQFDTGASFASLFSKYTGTDTQGWASYIATTTQSQPSSTFSISSATSTVPVTILTTINDDGAPVTSTYSLGPAVGTARSDSVNHESPGSTSVTSARIKAAIGIGAVIGVLAIATLVFFCLRNTRRNEESATGNEKLRSKWSNHFRNFTFDNEMLLSEQDTVRTRRNERSVIGSIRHTNADISSPRRNVWGGPVGQSPNTIEVPLPILIDTSGQGTLDRSVSVRTHATLPPPYQAAATTATADLADSPISPASTHRQTFFDSRSNSPIYERVSADENPFSDNHRH
ncbi:uncharacterized protein Z519_05558 [Cladophialophora bantiana CBS 173.52]|uniref:Mid2 domain-containing protein n=1 Tax=Cladophialophora bantiana (strain ATCC 10958 / CBS 173.52 / CDC B-1940 / NIH 8579) TaxID=1442370 RepID=A0A0D2G6K9_CLAB1|nr:uncharacterized protein Z519_05558 [Cladophialophora bantiana CBS 173.52]KIW94242.1 hypothetical protein Z519_05558 [Cladophialophora bantiana CBS 173.52]